MQLRLRKQWSVRVARADIPWRERILAGRHRPVVDNFRWVQCLSALKFNGQLPPYAGDTRYWFSAFARSMARACPSHFLLIGKPPLVAAELSTKKLAFAARGISNAEWKVTAALRKAAAALMFAAALFGAGERGRVDTLQGALSTAYQTNPQLNSQRAIMRATDENVPQAIRDIGRQSARLVRRDGNFNAR